MIMTGGESIARIPLVVYMTLGTMTITESESIACIPLVFYLTLCTI